MRWQMDSADDVTGFVTSLGPRLLLPVADSVCAVITPLLSQQETRDQAQRKQDHGQENAAGGKTVLQSTDLRAEHENMVC